MERRKRRGFTPEFKADTVKLALQAGKTVAAAARDLDLTESSVRAWVKQATIDAGRGLAGAPTPLPDHRPQHPIHRSWLCCRHPRRES